MVARGQQRSLDELLNDAKALRRFSNDLRADARHLISDSQEKLAKLRQSVERLGDRNATPS